MAEIWPRLKKKFSCDARRRKKSAGSKSKKVNPFASSGGEKFAALLEGVQAKKKSSLVERTGASVSAARSLSRSAQEWTASTLARTASRCSESREGSKSPEIVFLHCAVGPTDAQTRSSEYTESFSFAEAGFNPECLKVEKSQTESENVCEAKSPTSFGSLHGDLGNLSENRQSEVENFTSEEVRSSPTPSVILPVKTGRCLKKIRSLQRRSGWKQTSNSAFVVLVALGAFISSRFSKVGNSLAAVLTFNAVIRICRRGKLYARFMFSSVALYFLTPLRSYLAYCPRRLSLLPRKLKVIADTKPHLSTDGVSRNLEIEVAHEGRSSSFEISVLPLSAPPAAIKQGAPVSLLLTIPEGSAPGEAPASSANEHIPATVPCKESGTLSPSRRLAKKFSSRFKKLKMFRSSSSSPVSLLSDSESSLTSPSHSGTHFTGSSEPSSPISPAGSSSPDRHRKCPFSRRLHKSKSDIPSEAAEFHGDDATVHAIDKKLSGKKSRLCRMSTTEPLEQHSIGEITVTTTDSTPTFRSPALEETTDASRNVSWPMVGLLVTLLFLVVGRLPAIMATSLFLLVVSNAHHDRPHPRSRGRETRASEAARKLHSSPPPRERQHPGSPPRKH